MTEALPTHETYGLVAPGARCEACSGPLSVDERRAEEFCLACGLVTWRRVERVIVPDLPSQRIVRRDRMQSAIYVIRRAPKPHRRASVATGRPVGRPRARLSPALEEMARRLQRERSWGNDRITRALEAVVGATVSRRAVRNTIGTRPSRGRPTGHNAVPAGSEQPSAWWRLARRQAVSDGGGA